MILVSWLTGATALQWLSSLPPTANCNKLLTTLSESERLDCADHAARTGDPKAIKAALALVNAWGKDHPLHGRAMTLSNEWSRSLLGVARQEIDNGNLQKAIDYAKQVEPGSDIKPEADALIEQWQQNWEEGRDSLDRAKESIKKQDWTAASLEVRALVQLGDDYWQDRADQLLNDMAIERQAFQDLYQAQYIADAGQPKDYAEAIQLASKIDPKRLAKEEVQTKIEKWSASLLELSQEYQSTGQFDRAIEAAQSIPPDSSISDQATALIQLSNAQKVASSKGFVNYLHAWALADQINPDTPEYEKNKEKLATWEGEIQNAGQLQMAKLFANIDNVHLYQLAIDHAALVDPKQPQRIESQTLIAQWDQQINSYQDRQIIARARQFAARNTLLGFQAAIQEASKVGLNQPLRVEAQTLIAEWQGSLEIAEDQPILDQARSLAKTGKLEDAIKIATQIESDRELYKTAQDDIYAWKGEVEGVKDKPILQEAESLARAGRLSEAISVASQIGSDRVLYSEAQSRISEWAAARDAAYFASQRQQQARQEAVSENPPPAEAAAPPPEPYTEEPAPEQAPQTYPDDPQADLSRPVVEDAPQ
ncbi:MAG: hypothetical protein HC792_05215 [Acaryochloridaceae cyanobacterium CSU_5_19]|nr:hypothetical protein [Acaryochloridaceae cyanobacterium CSU_5_19]